MIKSMTGYGRGQAQIGGLSFSVEIKAVNHRYGDINIKAPRLLAALENDIKKMVSARLKRGKIDVFVSQDSSSKLMATPVVDEKISLAYVAAFQQLKKISGLSGDVGLEFLASQKDVLTFQDVEFATEDLQNCLSEALENALTALIEMREREGAATGEDIANRLTMASQFVGKIEELAAKVPLEWQQKLKDRLARLQENGGDPQRVAQEIAIFADRCDISEEISRFYSHLEQFRSLMQQQEPVGRQMDFLVQELNREANTMGSKSNDAELTRHVVALKAELEKIREQVQNIE